MGLAYLALNCLSVPRKPGIKKSKRDQSSSTLFCMGVPVRTSLCLARRLLTASVVLARPFLMTWPSSRTR